MSPDPPRPPRRRLTRRILIALGIATVGLAPLAALLPTMIGSAFARDRILARINATFAPGRLAVDRFEVSWTGPTRLVGLDLFAPDGARVARAPAATLDRSLGGLLFAAGRPVVLDLGAAELRVERRADGGLDLAEALRGAIAHPHPTQDRTILIRRGTLSVQADGMAGPIVARAVDLDLHVPPAPRPTTWDLKLAHPDGGELVVRGDTNRWTAPDADPARADLRIELDAKRWPIAHQSTDLVGQGFLDGTIQVARQAGRWGVIATTRLLDAGLSGPMLAGDTLRPGPVTLRCALGQDEVGWVVRQLELESAVGSAHNASPVADPDRPGVRTAARVVGRLDLATLARQLPHALHLRPGLVVDGGEARIDATWAGPLDNGTFLLDATLADLAARVGDRSSRLQDPATLSVRVVRRDDSITVSNFAARAAFGQAEAVGRLDDARLTGSVDLDKLRLQLAEWVDLGTVKVTGLVTLAGTYKVSDQHYQADLRIEGANLRLAGVASAAVEPPQTSLQLAASGPSSAPGWPVGCNSAELTAAAGTAEARVDLHRAGELWAIGGRLVAGVPSPEPGRQVEATVAGAWDGARHVLNCDRLAARLRDGHENPLLFAVAGQVDPKAGTARFDPIAGPVATTGPVRLGPAGVRVAGLGRDPAAIRVDVALVGDLAAAGDRWSATVQARGEDQGVRFTAQAQVEPAGGRPAASDPGSFRLAGRYDRAANRVELAECRVGSSDGSFAAVGQLADLAGARRFDLRGQVTPDFAALTARLQARVEPGAQVAGRGGEFHIGGSLAGPDLLRSIEGEIRLPLDGVDVCGIRLGPTPIVLRARGGEIHIDPISTTLNEGSIRLEPEVVLEDSHGEPVLRFGKDSTIRDARINEEVSRRVLAFAAPILEGTTRATGRVSVNLDHAEIPLRAGRARATQVDGAVVFDDVTFAPGPLAADLLGAIGRSEATLRLDRPVTLTIADGRVNQSGLALPIGDLTRIELAGWVDFDRNLDLTASLPVTAAMLGNNPLLANIAAGTQVRLPIGGTLDRPRVDRDALTASLRDLGQSLLTRGATRGALEILNRLGRPRDPNTPPPPTAAERRAARQERRDERKADRAGPP